MSNNPQQNKEPEGMKWSVEQAKVMSADFFQTDEGEPMAYVKLAYFGGYTTIMCSVEDSKKFKPHTGKMVSCGGALWVEPKKNGAKITFEIGYIR